MIHTVPAVDMMCPTTTLVHLLNNLQPTLAQVLLLKQPTLVKLLNNKQPAFYTLYLSNN